MAFTGLFSYRRYSFPAEWLWDLWCIGSLIGIWPRFIEPKLIKNSFLHVIIKNLTPALEGLRIAQFSDLHFNEKTSNLFIEKLIHKLNHFHPDIIVFTGDFLDHSTLSDADRLKKFLCSLKANIGHYAALGNHDYEKYVSINKQGDYDVKNLSGPSIVEGLLRLFTTTKLTGKISKEAKAVKPHDELCQLLKETPFEVLHNETKTLPIKNGFFNICGLGDYMAGKCSPKAAFKNYDHHYPGIVLTHNPDTIPMLVNYPGNIILCGHTHGGAVRLPGIYQKLVLLEHPHFARGRFTTKDRVIYVNRGVGATIPFRWFATPEVLLLTLTGGPS